MLTDLFHIAVDIVELTGVTAIVAGLIWASWTYLSQLRLAGTDHKGRQAAFRGYRANVGRSILLGLEFLVAADIIKTVAMEPTLQSVMVLGAVILVRTFLSFALQVEIDGRWPWQQAPEDREGAI